MERIIREDLVDLSRVVELGQIETLVSLLPERVGTLLGRASLRETLEVAFATVERWLRLLEELYVCFRLKPYHKGNAKSLRKESKLYLWDYYPVQSAGARFENLIALHLLKACNYWSDSGLGNFELFYLRDKGQREVDFLITNDSKPWVAVEVKLDDLQPTPHFKAFSEILSKCKLVCQVVKRDNYYRQHQFKNGKVTVISAAALCGKLV